MLETQIHQGLSEEYLPKEGKAAATLLTGSAEAPCTRQAEPEARRLQACESGKSLQGLFVRNCAEAKSRGWSYREGFLKGQLEILNPVAIRVLAEINNLDCSLGDFI